MTSTSENVCIDKLVDVVNEYNNTYHYTIKMMSIDAKSSTYLTLVQKIIIKIINFKLVTMREYQNIKSFLRKFMLQIGLKKFL